MMTKEQETLNQCACHAEFRRKLQNLVRDAMEEEFCVPDYLVSELELVKLKLYASIAHTVSERIWKEESSKPKRVYN